METKQPLVSIALCTYNGEKYLREQIDSLIKQDYSNIEIVIVDDASTDKTIEIIQSYKLACRQIKLLINKSNIGFNKNFEKAIANCNGDFIAISDQDDIWLPNKISVMMKNIKDDMLLYHDSEFIDENSISTSKSISTLHRFVKANCTVQLLYNNCVSGHAFLFRKSFIDIIPDIPKGMYYDWWFAYTAACIGKLNFINLKLVKYRRHSTSSTITDISNSKAKRIKHLTFFLNHPLTPQKTKNLIDTLIAGYNKLEKNAASALLFLTFLKNFNTIFFIRKRSFVSNINFILNECHKSN